MGRVPPRGPGLEPMEEEEGRKELMSGAVAERTSLSLVGTPGPEPEAFGSLALDIYRPIIMQIDQILVLLSCFFPRKKRG